MKDIIAMSIYTCNIAMRDKILKKSQLETCLIRPRVYFVVVHFHDDIRHSSKKRFLASEQVTCHLIYELLFCLIFILQSFAPLKAIDYQ